MSELGLDIGRIEEEADVEVPAVALLLTEHDRALADEELASWHGGTTLITASAASDVERVARRIHAAGPGAARSFVTVSAAALPLTRAALVEACERLIHAATGGTLLLSGIEDMHQAVQDDLIDILAQVQTERGSLPAAKVIAGTTVFLTDRIAAGTFSDRLFYRLNTIHVVTSPAAGSTTG